MAEGTTNGYTKVWSKDFLMICTVNFFIALSVYMLLPSLPDWLAIHMKLSAMQVALTMAIPGLGVFFFGGICSYLTQKYRRNKVCITAILLLAANILTIKYVTDNAELICNTGAALACALCSRFFLSAFFGLAYLVLNSTLTIDCCDTSQRTRANVISSRLYLVAAVLGPIAGLYVKNYFGNMNVFYASASLCCVSAFTLCCVKFPFKAPEETVKKFSSDRFIIPSSMPLAIPVAMVSACLAMLMIPDTTNDNAFFLPVGIILGIILQRIALPNVGHGKQTFCGCALLVLSIAVLCIDCLPVASVSARISAGVATAILLGNLHLGITNTAGHCQRGTAQSTYILFFELGMAVGVFVYLSPQTESKYDMYKIALALSLLTTVVLAASTRRFISRKLK